MGRAEKIMSVALVAILIVLVALYLFQMEFRDENPRIYRVSVIVDNENSEYWQGFKTGLEQASVDNNVDYHFISYSPEADHEQQVAGILREIESGTDAIILAPVDVDKMEQFLVENSINVPIISIGDRMDALQVTLSIVSDEHDMGRMLGEQLYLTTDRFQDIYVFTHRDAGEREAARCEGLRRLFNLYGVNYHIIELTEERTVAETTQYIGKGCLIGLTDDVVQQLCEFASAKDGNFSIYGIGYTIKTLGYLDTGLVKCLIVQSRFELGYVSVENAVKAINGNILRNEMTLGYFVADKQTIGEHEMKLILYPIS